MSDIVAFILSFYIETPVAAGIITGAVMFGVPFYAIGWFHGGDAAMRRANAWIRKDEVHGDVPNLPPVRERRLDTVAHRESLS
jgi:hypothetical protein